MKLLQVKLLEIENVGVSFGGVQALQGVNFFVEAGEIFSIVGPNGAGKTTLFNVISGIYRASTGHVRLKQEDVTGRPSFQLARKGLSRTFQNLQIFFRMSVRENVMVGLHRRETTSWLADFLGAPSVRRQNAESCKAAEGLLRRVGLSHRADEIAASLSYGELKRLEIARALATEPDLLMLDEPAAGCNASETAELSELIREMRKAGVTVMLVEHDMGMVMSVSDRILVLDQGRVLAEGDAQSIRNNPAVIAAYLGAQTAGGAAVHAGR